MQLRSIQPIPRPAGATNVFSPSYSNQLHESFYGKERRIDDVDDGEHRGGMRATVLSTPLQLDPQIDGVGQNDQSPKDAHPLRIHKFSHFEAQACPGCVSATS